MLSTPSELQVLMSRVGAGDRQAFAALYQATSAKLYGVVLRILKRRDIADEVVQETYVRIWNNASSFDPTRASPISGARMGSAEFALRDAGDVGRTK